MAACSFQSWRCERPLRHEMDNVQAFLWDGQSPVPQFLAQGPEDRTPTGHALQRKSPQDHGKRRQRNNKDRHHMEKGPQRNDLARTRCLPSQAFDHEGSRWKALEVCLPARKGLPGQVGTNSPWQTKGNSVVVFRRFRRSIELLVNEAQGVILENYSGRVIMRDSANVGPKRRIEVVVFVFCSLE